MRDRIDDKAAIAFAAALYGALADGQSVDVAFRLGSAAVEAVNAQQNEFLQLFHAADVDPSMEVLVKPRPVRWPYWAIAAGPAVGLLALAAAKWLPGHPPRPVPPRDMAGIDAADVHPGVFNRSQRPPECSPPREEPDCVELGHPERVAPVHVGAFDLDTHEVTTGDFVMRLNGSAESWHVQKTQTAQVIATRRDPQVALAVAEERCGVSINAEGHVVADPDRAHWPVVCVTWDGAQEYCRSHHKRLPSEVEWELAAKGDRGGQARNGDRGLRRSAPSCEPRRAEGDQEGEEARPDGRSDLRIQCRQRHGLRRAPSAGGAGREHRDRGAAPGSYARRRSGVDERQLRGREPGRAGARCVALRSPAHRRASAVVPIAAL